MNFGTGIGIVNIDNLFAGGNLKITNGDQADSVFIERGDFAGNSVIAGRATILTGNSDDTVLIARATPPPQGGAGDSTRVRFLGGLDADGGDLLNDTRNDFNAENEFPLGPTAPANFEVVV